MYFFFTSDAPRYGSGSETPMHPSRTPLHPYMTPMRDPGGLFFQSFGFCSRNKGNLNNSTFKIQLNLVFAI